MEGAGRQATVHAVVSAADRSPGAPRTTFRVDAGDSRTAMARSGTATPRSPLENEAFRPSGDPGGDLGLWSPNPEGGRRHPSLRRCRRAGHSAGGSPRRTARLASSRKAGGRARTAGAALQRPGSRKIRSSPPAGAAPSPHARPVRTRLPCGEEREDESMGRGGCQGIYSLST